MSLKERIIANIKYYREQANLSQEELSLKLGRKKDFIKKLEDNKYKREPTIVLIYEIAVLLNLSMDELILDEK